MSERNFVLNEEIVFWIKLLSNKIKIKEIQATMDLGIGTNAFTWAVLNSKKRETSPKIQLY